MGMDGLSMSNTGVLKESTSADYASRNEQVMQQDPTNDTKQVQTTSTNRPVREKDEEEEGKKKKRQQNSEEEFEDGLEDSNQEVDENEAEEAEIEVEDLNNPNKDFYVKLNSKYDTIELYDSSNDRLIESISGNELGALVRKLNMASGIFVNKKV